MPRVKLKKKDIYEFEYNTQIKVRDLNYGGHLGNDALVGILHEARVDLFHLLGVSELDLGDEATGIILTDLSVNYLGEGHLFDALTVFSHIGEIGKTGFRIFHYMANGDKTIALAETGIKSFDYKTRRVVSNPECFINRLKKINK